MTTPAISPEILSRYLADRLTEREREDFESQFTRSPDMVRELEETLRFREGLAVLRERGDLPRILQARGMRPRWIPWALAATLAAVALAAALWVRPLSGDRGGVLATLPRSAASVDRTYTFVTTRGGSDRLAVTAPAVGHVLEFRMLPDAKSPAGRYRVSLERPAADGAVVVATLEHLTAGADGFVIVYADLARLAGPYALTIEPERDPGSASRFAIELSPGGSGGAPPP